MTNYAEDLPYWNTGRSGPEAWLRRAEVEIERAGGKMLGSGFARDGDRAAYMIRFGLDGDTFRVVWPVLKSKDWSISEASKKRFLISSRRQAATMLYRDIKSTCVKARVLGARAAFFAHLEVDGGKVASQLAVTNLPDFQLALAAGAPEVVDAEAEEVES